MCDKERQKDKLKRIMADTQLGININSLSDTYWDEVFEDLSVNLINNGVEVVKKAHWEWFETWIPSTPDNVRECEEAGWRCSNCTMPLADVVGGYWDDFYNPPEIKRCPECGAYMEVAMNNKMISLGKDNPYGYFAFIDGYDLVIGEDWPREGGEIYRGKYFGDRTPGMLTLKEKSPRIYNEVVKYFEEHPEMTKDIEITDKYEVIISELGSYIFKDDAEKYHLREIYNYLIALHHENEELKKRINGAIKLLNKGEK